MTDTAVEPLTRGHILTLTDSEWSTEESPSWDYAITCINVANCGGWWTCTVEGCPGLAEAIDGPSIEGEPWSGQTVFTFHGEVHTWREGHGWTTTYPGCNVASNDWLIGVQVYDLGTEHGAGAYLMDDAWDEDNSVCTLTYIRDALPSDFAAVVPVSDG